MAKAKNIKVLIGYDENKQPIFDNLVIPIQATNLKNLTTATTGEASYITKPSSEDTNKFLRGDGTWVDISGSSGSSNIVDSNSSVNFALGCDENGFYYTVPDSDSDSTNNTDNSDNTNNTDNTNTDSTNNTDNTNDSNNTNNDPDNSSSGN